ncbi:sporulation phosphorelay system protein KapB [Radiobacillus sp. PE A8.2]|uniref:sporulation phosphorelay system protein KapB n=1 Tax=Radiobacillus sp. PE A8.2 TaxID=3380349 RepID=UPI00388EA0E7
MDNATIEQTVLAHYRSGSYFGKIIEDRGERYLVEVLAVKKHPLQGDLHNYGETENVFFHQRKALSYKEKMNVSKSAVHIHDEEIPIYKDSLKQAVDALKTKLSKDDKPFNHAALNSLKELEKYYFE